MAQCVHGNTGKNMSRITLNIERVGKDAIAPSRRRS
jgi:hypothetical protein